MSTQQIWQWGGPRHAGKGTECMKGGRRYRWVERTPEELAGDPESRTSQRDRTLHRKLVAEETT